METHETKLDQTSTSSPWTLDVKFWEQVLTVRFFGEHRDFIILLGS